MSAREMTDRELLELAAKAAGIECEVEEFSSKRCFGTNQYNEIIFDPLDDGGDALRLAATIGKSFGLSLTITRSGVVAYCEDRRFYEYGNDAEPSDFNAATRRAIVRAAAEIAKQQETPR